MALADWISVKDRLPKKGTWLLAVELVSGLPCVWYGCYAGKGVWRNNEDEPSTITHWQPLPEPPEVT